jgi:hypothetical protein
MALLAQLELSTEMLVRTGGKLAGLACIYLAMRLILRRRAIRRDPVRTKGKVLSLDREPSEEGPDWYTPTVRYRDEHDEVHEAKLTIIRDTEAYAVGKKVSIEYERGNPKNLIDPNDAGPALVAYFLLLGVGVVIFLFAALGEVVPAK